MPVPVSPCKDESSQSASVGIPGAMTIPLQEAARSPPSSPTPQNLEEVVDPDVVAGYQDCLKETLRFLLEEEHLPMDHPVIMGLAAHLTRDHAHVELSKLSQELTCESASSDTTATTSLPGTVSSIAPRAITTGYEVTLVEESEPMNESEYLDECSDIEDIECEEYSDSEEAQVTEAIMSNPELRRQLLRFVYQGCDLIAAPQPISELQPGLIVQL